MFQNILDQIKSTLYFEVLSLPIPPNAVQMRPINDSTSYMETFEHANRSKQSFLQRGTIRGTTLFFRFIVFCFFSILQNPRNSQI